MEFKVDIKITPPKPKSFTDWVCEALSLTILIPIFLAVLGVIFVVLGNTGVFLPFITLIFIARYFAKRKDREDVQKDREWEEFHQVGQNKIEIRWLDDKELDHIYKKYSKLSDVLAEKGFYDELHLCRVKTTPNTEELDEVYFDIFEASKDGDGIYLLKYVFEPEYNSKLIYLNMNTMKTYEIADLGINSWWPEETEGVFEIWGYNGNHGQVLVSARKASKVD